MIFCEENSVKVYTRFQRKEGEDASTWLGEDHHMSIQSVTPDHCGTHSGFGYIQYTCFSFIHETDHLFYQKNDDPWLLFFDKSACHVKSYAIFPSLVPPGEVQEEPRRLRSQGLSLNFAGKIIIISSLLWHFLKVCPFNASHHVPAPEVDFHVRTCSDRKVRLALFLKPASILTWCQGGGDGEVQLVDAAAKAAWKLEVAGEWGLSCGKKTLDCLILLCIP